MPYLSPYELAGITPDTPLSAEDWKRVKRKWLAEFEWTDEPVIVVKGITMDKQQVLSLFEDTGSLQRMHFHRMVYQNPQIYHFLKGERWQIEWKIPLWWPQNHTLRQWISPWLAERMAAEIKTRLDNPDQEGTLASLFELKQLLLPEYYQAAYQPFLDFITQSLAIQYRDIQFGGGDLVPKLRMLARLVAKLPDKLSLFKHQTVRALLDLTLFYGAIGRFRMAHKFYQLLDFLPDNHGEDELRAKTFQILQKRDKFKARQNSPEGMGLIAHRERVIMILVNITWIIFILFRISRCVKS